MSSAITSVLGRRRGFTLIELLVVVSIVGLLAALLLPSLTRGRESALNTQCMANVRAQALGTVMYTNDNNQILMRVQAFSGNIAGGQGGGSVSGGTSDWQVMYRDYLGGNINQKSLLGWNGHTAAQLPADSIRFYTHPSLVCPLNAFGSHNSTIGPTNYPRLTYAYYTGSSYDYALTMDALQAAGSKPRASGSVIPSNIPALCGDRVNLWSAGNNGGRDETNHTHTFRDGGASSATADPAFVPDGGNVGRVDGSVLWFNSSTSVNAYTTQLSVNWFVEPYGGSNGQQTLMPSNMICFVTDGFGNITSLDMGYSYHNPPVIFPGAP